MMHPLVFLIICLLPLGGGMIRIGTNKIYNIVFHASSHAQVSAQCKNSLELYVKNFENFTSDDQWALQMLDASSKTPSGLLSYNIGEMGHFEQCLSTNSKYSNIKGKYCLGYMSVQNYSSFYSYNDQNYLKRIFSKITPIIPLAGTPTWAVCLPSNCSEADLSRILMNNTIIKFELTSLSCQTEEDINEPFRPEAIVAIFVLSILLYLIIVSTAYDITCTRMKKQTSPILLIFSVYTNSRGLFKARNDPNPLECLNGIKVLSMMWIILLHTFSIYGSAPLYNAKNLIEFKDSWICLLVYGGDMACDTFLLVGGLLVTYTFFKSKAYERRFNIVHYYLHRYFRLAPTLAGAVLISATLLRYMGSGPKWSVIVNNFEGFCKENWWSSLLFIQNYVSLNRLCVGHSWYIDVDMQLYLLSPIFLFLLLKNFKAGFTLIIFLCLSSITYGFYFAFKKELSGLSTNFYPKGDITTYTNYFYLQTHTRASPWLLGLILGYCLVQREPKKTYNKLIVLSLWLICMLVLASCIFGGYPTLRTPEYDRIGNSFYIAVTRPVWSLCIAYIIWACANGCGGVINKFLSLPVFQVMNKFTYSMYIIHVTLLYMIVYGMKTSIHFDIFDILHNFFAIVAIVFCISVCWVFTFELPMLKLEKLCFKRR